MFKFTGSETSIKLSFVLSAGIIKTFASPSTITSASSDIILKEESFKSVCVPRVSAALILPVELSAKFVFIAVCTAVLDLFAIMQS